MGTGAPWGMAQRLPSLAPQPIATSHVLFPGPRPQRAPAGDLYLDVTSATYLRR
jgi:hypothetical protein